MLPGDCTLSCSVRSVALRICGAALLLPLPAPLLAQADTTQRPEANPADVESVDAIVSAGFDAISGASNKERDWERFQSLFHPDARLVATGRPEGEPAHRTYPVPEYVKVARKAGADSSLYERVVHTEIERYGDIAQVWVTYEARNSPDGEVISRGIEAFHLWYDGDRWWIMNVLGHGEREGAPIPERYRGGSPRQ